ncbi:MAG: hypothetical protein KC505_04435, partial [Myxococcales bacterium]|nr:hypothetical protein [Myxococcales bacterium]
MRSFVVTMSLMFVAFSGFSEDAALMSRVTSGGMTPPEMSGWSSGITLFESGRVITSYCPNYATPCMTEELAILSSK